MSCKIIGEELMDYPLPIIDGHLSVKNYVYALYFEAKYGCTDKHFPKINRSIFNRMIINQI